MEVMSERRSPKKKSGAHAARFTVKYQKGNNQACARQSLFWDVSTLFALFMITFPLYLRTQYRGLSIYGDLVTLPRAGSVSLHCLAHLFRT